VTTVLFGLAVLAAASVCPALMWRNARRGRHGCLRGRRSAESGGADLGSLRRRQAELADRIGELEARMPPTTR
jgi:hypothetical protein